MASKKPRIVFCVTYENAKSYHKQHKIKDDSLTSVYLSKTVASELGTKTRRVNFKRAIHISMKRKHQLTCHQYCFYVRKTGKISCCLEEVCSITELSRSVASCNLLINYF